MSDTVNSVVTDSFMDLIDGETVADVMTILSKYQADDVIEVEWSGYEEVDIYVYRTREKTEEELQLDTFHKEMEAKLSETRKQYEGKHQDLLADSERARTVLKDNDWAVRRNSSDLASEVDRIRFNYAQKAETVI